MHNYLVEYQCQYEQYGPTFPNVMWVQANSFVEAHKEFTKEIALKNIAWAYKPTFQLLAK